MEGSGGKHPAGNVFEIGSPSLIDSINFDVMIQLDPNVSIKNLPLMVRPYQDHFVD